MDATDVKALEAALAPQETTFDEGGLRFYVVRLESRVDVRFRTLGREGAPLHDDMEPLWLLTAVLCGDGLRMIEQENGSGEDGAQFFLLLEKHLLAHPPLPMPTPVDVCCVQVSGHNFRARRFNQGWGEAVRVDLRVEWKDGAPASWLHAFDAELMPVLLGHAASLRVGATSEMFVRAWGQIEHLVRFGVYAALVSAASSAEIAGKLPSLLAWGTDESVFAPKGGA